MSHDVDSYISESLPKKFKVVVVGDQGVGKTSIVKRFIYDTWETNYSPTVGIDFLCKTVYLENRTVRLQMWDTAGLERFRSLIPSYIRDSCVAIVVYDITNVQSFRNSFQWMEEVRTQRGEDIIIALVGNKTDLAPNRRVSLEELRRKANEHDVMFLETSAKEGYNIKLLFRQIAESLPSTTSGGRNGTGGTGGQGDDELYVVPLRRLDEDGDGEGGDQQTTGYCDRC